MVQQTFFDVSPVERGAAPEPQSFPGRKRMRYAVRNQVEFQECSLDELLSQDDAARIVWEYVCGLNLVPITDRIAAVEGGPGASPADPRILMSLWLYATIRGVGSARRLNELCVRDLGFRWVCGGVSMNYHTLSDFRTAHVEVLDQLLTQSVATLLEQGLVSLQRVAQDGMKVRASAGASLFRRKPTLEECLQAAEAQLADLRQELEADPQIEASKKQADKEKARASTTDPEARIMKMGDGGFRPAYNVQLASATDSLVITGVEVTNSGGDQGKMAPMVEQHQQRYGTTVYAPVMKSKDPHRDPHVPRGDDSPAVAR